MAESAGGRVFSRDGMLCAALVGLSILATWPVADIGINDDWSSIRTTQVFAQTHHFVYNGWLATILGWQVVWGGLFAWVFGPSFTAIRLSVVPVALLTTLLYHAILRRFGLNRAHAIFGTLVLSLSPLYLALSDTFMSDIPGLFSILLCLYLCQRAIAATEDSHAAMWLVFAGLTNILTGTTRQIAWLGVLIMVPSCGWLLRRRRYIMPATIVTWIVAVVSIKFFLNWFLRHPYSIPERILQGPIHLHELIRLVMESVRGFLSTSLFLLPVLVLLAAAVWPPRRALLLRIAAVVAVLGTLSAVFGLKDRADIIRFPWLAGSGNIITPHGVMQDAPLFGSLRQPSNGWQLLLLFIFAVCFVAAIDALRWYSGSKLSAAASAKAALGSRETLVLSLPFLACYFLLLASRAAFVVLFDRYVLLPVAFLLFFLLHWHQDRIAPAIPTAAVVVLGVLAVLGIAATHDLFALNRAEVRLTDELLRAGVPRTQIRGGFDFDSITQVDAAGYLNDPHLINPPGSYHPNLGTPEEEGPCGYAYLRYVPSLRTRYVISADPTPCLGPTNFAPQTYWTWLPPAKRQLFVGTLLFPDRPNDALTHNEGRGTSH